MKSTLFSITGSVFLTLTVGATAEAVSFTGSQPIPEALMEYIELAEAGLLPDPLDNPDITTLWVAGGRNSFIDTVDMNGGKYSLFDLYVPPNIGPPLHFHTLEDEWFYVVDGNPSFQHDEHAFTGEPGTLLFSPVFERHAFKNTTSEGLRMLLFYEPNPADDPTAIGNIERFFLDERVGQEVTDPFTPPPFNPAELLTAGPEYGLFFPSTFVFTAPEFTGNEVSILRTGEPFEAANVLLDLGNGTDLSVDFGAGEFLQTVTLPSGLGNQTLNLMLKDPSEGSFLGLIENKAVVNVASVPESSFPVGVLAFGALGAGLMLKNRKSNQWNVERQFMFDSPKLKPSQTVETEV
jgi:mannose-6-phosphate isomerase-like protein (cupin superfamily)